MLANYEFHNYNVLDELAKVNIERFKQLNSNTMKSKDQELFGPIISVIVAVGLIAVLFKSFNYIHGHKEAFSSRQGGKEDPNEAMKAFEMA